MPFSDHPPKFTLNVYVILKEEEEEVFQMVCSVMNTAIWRKFQRDIYVSMNIQCNMRLCPYLCLYLDYQTSSYYNTLDLNDISEFEDLMTTSSDKDIPALEDVGY